MPLDFGALFVFDYDEFLGSWRKGGIGGGSARRMAVGAIVGPKQGGRGSRRKKSFRLARAEVAAMSPAEVAAAASAVAAAMGEHVPAKQLHPSARAHQLLRPRPSPASRHCAPLRCL